MVQPMIELNPQESAYASQLVRAAGLLSSRGKACLNRASPFGSSAGWPHLKAVQYLRLRSRLIYLSLGWSGRIIMYFISMSA